MALTPRKAVKVAAALLRKGFCERNGKDRYFILTVNGSLTHVRTKMSHGADECDDFILTSMRHQLHLKGQELAALLDCPLGHDDYGSILRRRGVLRPVLPD